MTAQKFIASILIIITVCYQMPVSLSETESDDLPLIISDNTFQPLRKLVNRKLQNSLVSELRRNKKWDNLITKKKMAVGLIDLSMPEDVKFASVNGDVMMYAASLPKLAILLAASQSLEDGLLKETPDILDDMHKMISVSDNAAASRMIDRLGGFQNIEKILRDPRYKLYDPSYGGGLWVGKRYARTGKRYPDPITGLSHGATVNQVCRYYYLLAFGRLVSPQRSRQMLDIMEEPEIHHKFVNTLDKIAHDAKIYRKSGTWKNWHADSVLVWGPVWRRYVLVGLIEDPEGEKICRELILSVEQVLKNQKKPEL